MKLCAIQGNFPVLVTSQRCMKHNFMKFWILCINKIISYMLEVYNSIVKVKSFTCTTILSCCSVAKSCPTVYDPMNCSRPGIPLLHSLFEFSQIDAHWVSDTIQPSHLLLMPSVFTSVRIFSNELTLSASASVLPMNIQGWFPVGLTCLISLLSKGRSRVFSSTTVQKLTDFSIALSLLYAPTVTSIHDYWKNHSFD